MATVNPDARPDGQQTFETREYDVTDSCCQAIHVLTCPLTFMAVVPGVMGSKKLLLEPEEVQMTIDCGICKQDKRLPYGELGDVGKCECMCFKGIGAKGVLVCPGNGCRDALVDEIVDELKRRQRGRGDTAQIKRSEETKFGVQQVQHSVAALHGKLDLLLKHNGIYVPVELHPPPTEISMSS
jgi:hypothetical protein